MSPADVSCLAPRSARNPKVASSEMLLFGAGWQTNDAGCEHRKFAVLILGALRHFGIVRARFRESPLDLAVDIQSIADRIVAADFHLQLTQETRATHPICKMMRHPGASLGAVVVGRGRADQRREVILPMHAFRHIGDAEFVGNPEPRMFLQLLPRHLVRADIQPAPSLRERDEAGDSHRTFYHGREFVTDVDILYIARSRAADFLGLVERENFREVLARVLHRRLLLHRFVFGAALAGGVALGAETTTLAL